MAAIDGTNNDDVLTGTSGADTINGFDGNDTILGGGGSDTVDGGAGIDTFTVDLSGYTTDITMSPFWQPDPHTITTTGLSISLSNIERVNITGGSGNDVLYGGSNDYTLLRVGGATLSGGDGNDTLYGGDGNDTLLGGNGNDTLNGGYGTNTLDGGAGVNTADFNNPITAWTVTFNVDGTITVASIYGDSVDTLTNIQYLTFNTFDRTALGTAGNDVLTADGSALYLMTGEGDDTITINTANQRIWGGPGTDTAIFSGNIASYTFNHDYNLATFTTDGTQFVSLKDVELAQFADCKIQLGYDDNDNITRASDVSEISAGLGDDVITAGTGTITIDGGLGYDTVILSGNVADYTLTQGTVVGGVAPIILTSATGTYTITRVEKIQFDDATALTSASAVLLTGTSGDDYFIPYGGGFYPSYDGGPGTDTVWLPYSLASIGYVVGYDLNGNIYAGNLTFSNIEHLRFSEGLLTLGTPGDDIFSGTPGDDLYIGGNGNDVLSGGAGNDTLVAGPGTFDGGPGNDTLVSISGTGTAIFSGSFYAYTVTQTANSNTGNYSVISGPDGTDTLVQIYKLQFGDGQARLLAPGGFNDFVLNPSEDFVLTDDGDDSVQFTTVPSRAILVDGGSGTDTVTVRGDYTDYAFSFNGYGNPVLTRGGFSLTLRNVELVTFQDAAGPSHLYIGTTGNDVLNGGAEDNIIFGGPGNDTISDLAGQHDIALFSGTYGASQITFNLNGSFTVTGPDGTDTLNGIEKVKFSDEIVTLGTTGDDAVTLNGFFDGRNGVGFAGGSGNDTVTSNGGQIFFDGGAGTDTIVLPVDYSGISVSVNGYENIVGNARLLNVEVVEFNNATATLSNGQLTLTAAQPVLSNATGTVQVADIGSPTTLAPNIVVSNAGPSAMTGAVIRLASGFVDGDILTVDLSGTSISASYDAATGILTLSGADTAAHYQQALRTIQMIANATVIDHPSVGSITWQVTNAGASHNVSALVSTTLNLPQPSNNFAATTEAAFISGIYTNGKIAAHSFATWLGDAPAHYDTQYSDAVKWGANTPGTAGGDVSYYFDPASSWTATEQTVIGAGLALWSALANISFTVTTNPANAEITFVRGHDGNAATTHTTTIGDANVGRINTADLSQFAGAVVSIDTSVPGFGPIGDFSAYGGYAVNTVLHEEGHALGLGHAGPYNGTNVAVTQESTYDSLLWSLMSYIEPEDTSARWYGNYSPSGTKWGTTTEATGTYGNVPTTPMALDIAAAQLLYGAPVSTPLSGGQVFGFNTNITGAIRPFFDFTQNTNPIVTLWDMGTDNTLDLSGFSTNSAVNLNPGTFSSADGMVNNIAIATNTRIDRFVGGAGNDAVVANNNGDALFGGLGNDVFIGGLGNDTLDGGGGRDKAIYRGNYGTYTITHNADGSVTITGAYGADTLTHIETAAFDDRTVTIAVVTAADFNGQGRSDLVWQNTGGQPVVWMMNGTTVLNQAAVGSNPGPSWHVKTTGDFDGDGNADILWQNDGGQGQIWFLNGASIVGNQAAGSNPGPTWHIIATGDFDADGRADILWQSDSGQAAVWLMNGASVAGSAAIGANPGTSWHVKATADFDGDAKADILWQNDSGQAAIWLMNGTAMAGGAALANNPGPSWHAVGAGDFDGDMKSDILWQNNNGQVQIWLMNGTIVSSTNVLGTNPGANWHIKGTADLDGDGKSDILWQSNSGQAMAWLMDGTTVSSNALLGSNPGPNWQIANYGTVPQKIANDFDGDRNSDLLWQSDSGQAALWFLNGSSFTSGAAAGSNPGASWHVKGAGDFDGDGKADMLWQNDNGQTALWLMNGAMVADGVAFANNPGSSWHVVAARDFDGDGKADIVWQNDSGQAALWFINGTNFTGGTVLSPSPAFSLHVKGAGDFDGDGQSDILLQDDSGQAAIWLMDGSTVSSNLAVGSNPSSSWHVKGAGDFDGDGKSDILWQNDSGQAAIWLMDGTTVTNTSLAGSDPGPSWQVMGAADINGDGMSDILWQNTGGQAAAWLMSGTHVLSTAAIGANPGSTWHLVAASA